MAKGKACQLGVILAVVACLFSAPMAFADGCYVWKETFLGQAKSGGQQALLLYFSGRETLVLQTGYEGELANFSWLIPTPSPVSADDVHEADANAYYWLDDITAPSFYLLSEPHSRYSYRSEGGGCSCSRGDSGGGAKAGTGSDDQDHVEVLETILTESYEVIVLATTEAQDLVDWLNQNDYTYPTGAEAVFGDYIRRGWYFLAVRIRPSNPGLVTKQALAPIQISLETDEPVLPMKISSLSSDPETEILIHFISDGRYKTSNTACEEVPYYYIDDPENYKHEYQNRLKEDVADRGGRVYFVEYAGWLDSDDCLTINDSLSGGPLICSNDMFVTRFRSFFSPDLFSDDIYFEQDADNDFFSVSIDIMAHPFSHASLFLISLFMLTTSFVIPKNRFPNAIRNVTRCGSLALLCLLLF
jgi:hypothetical protein